MLIKQLSQDFNDHQFKQFYQEYVVYQKIVELAENEQKYFANLEDCYQINGTYNLVLTYYQGKTLKQFSAENYLSFSQKITLLIEICQALEIFHSVGLIHCDIKPSNILIANNQIKLLDFGLAKTRGEKAIADNFTAGTPVYMSPEQLTGGVITYQSDYYSLGILMYECLLEKAPFNADTLEDWALAHCQTPIPYIRRFNHEQNQTIQAILQSLLAKCPVNRSHDLIQIKSWLKILQQT